MKPEHIALIISIFTTISSVAGMQFKNMKYVIISQLIANSLLAVQYIIDGTVAAGGIVFLAIIQTIIGFVYTHKGISFPLWLTLVFIGGYTALTIITYTNPFDLVSLVAVWCFAFAIIQKNSAICRILSLTNATLWLTYDIACAPSAIITHAVIVVFIIIAIVRLDRAEWRVIATKLKNKLSSSKKGE